MTTPNRDLSAAWKYHTGTNHTWQSVYHSPHYMDWNNQPRPFKVYRDLEPLSLPSGISSSGVSALESMAGVATEGRCVPTLSQLAGLFHHSAGITKALDSPGGRMYFRAAACTGALYHIELYLVCGDLPDLPAGVYHFGAHDFALRRLREGEYQSVLVEATGGEPSVAEAPAVIVTSSVYWRNAWKYQDRAYRHAYWDSGTVLANLLAVGNAYEVPLKVVASFADEPVNNLLGLDAKREVALQLVPVGRDPGNSAPSAREVMTLALDVEPYSRDEIEYPAMGDMHAASTLGSSQEVRELWGRPPSPMNTEPEGPLVPLALPSEEHMPKDSIEDVILRRGSSRRFRRAPISYSQLSIMLDRAAQHVPADFLDPPIARPELVEGLNQLYVIANDVDGLPSGSYVFHPKKGSLEQLSLGDFRDQAGGLDLGQELAADASVNVYFLSGLEAVLERYGNRGYRMAQMEASIMGGRLYLGAYAQGLGASGLTFFDDEVVEFFSPHAAGKSVMFLVALGRPARRRPSAGDGD